MSAWFHRIGIAIVFIPLIAILVQLLAGEVVYNAEFRSGLSAAVSRFIAFAGRFDIEMITSVFGMITCLVFLKKGSQEQPEK